MQERGEHKGDRRERGDEKCGQPKPPLAARQLPQGGFRLLRAESVRPLKRRGSGSVQANTEHDSLFLRGRLVHHHIKTLLQKKATEKWYRVVQIYNQTGGTARPSTVQQRGE